MKASTIPPLVMSQQGTAAPSIRSRFFVGMSALLLLIVLTGFARTLYLRAYLGLPSMPMYLYVHGTVLTVWFLLAFAQTCLVATHRTYVHRRLGVAGVVVAAGVVAVSVLTVALRDAPVVDEAPRRAFGNLMTLIAFSACIVSGIWLRNRPAAHKRLMLLASISIVAPALDRMARRPPLSEFSEAIFNGALGPPEIAFATAGFFCLLLVVFVHDAMSERRLHPATLWGVVCILVIAPSVSAALIFSGVWRAFVRLVG